jgi:hypothetical protein
MCYVVGGSKTVITAPCRVELTHFIRRLVSSRLVSMDPAGCPFLPIRVLYRRVWLKRFSPIGLTAKKNEY